MHTQLRYSLTPICTYVVSVGLYAHSPRSFWRVLAYLAVYHFIRQQIGWVALYRSRSGSRATIDKWIDDAAIYAATVYPIVHWHGRLGETQFNWFVPGDFVDVSNAAAQVTPVAKALWVVCLAVFVARQLQVFVQTREIQLGKIVVVGTTVAIWYVGIVATNSDFEFTVTNVIVHGVPYFALLYFYGRALRVTRPKALGAQVMAGGVSAFFGLLLVLAFIEEMAWNRLVYNDHDWLFGAGSGALGAGVLVFVVPLLSLPQATHYVLDGMLWRRRDTRSNAAQRAAVGFGPQR